MDGIYPFLSGKGEMSKLMRSFNWKDTSVGPINDWPQSLKTILGLITFSRFPMLLFWGPDLTCFYNDAFRPSLGSDGKHPSILGMPGGKAWAEIWHIISPLILQVMEEGEATWSEDQLIPIFRNGTIEDVYWTFSYSPALDENGKIAGVLVTCAETTDKVTAFKNLEESKDQLHFAIEAAELATWDYNPLTNKFLSNARLKMWFGLQPDDEIELQDATDAIGEKDKIRVDAAIRRALTYSSGGYYDIEYCIVNKITKQEKIVQAKGRAWFTADGLAYRFNGTLEDVTEQVTARKKLEEKEEQLRIALEAARMGTFDYYPETDSMLWSAKTKALFGLPADADVNYEAYLQAIHPSDRARSRAIAEEQKKIGTEGLYELEYRATGITDGMLRWLRSNGKVSYNSEGYPTRYTGVTQDITERKQAEEQRMKLNTIIDSSNEFICLAGSDTSVLYCNAAALKKLGWESIRGRFMIDFVYPADRNLARRILPELFEKESFQHEIRFWNEKTGEPFWLQWNGTVIKDSETNSIVALATVSADITERKKAEDALRSSEHRLRSLVESAPFPIGVYVGREMRITLVNDAILAAWGRTRNVVGKRYADVLTELVGQGIYEQLDAVFTTGVPFHAKNQFLELMVDGKLQPYYYNYSFTPLYDDDGKIYGVLNTAANVTDLALATQKIEESERRFRNTVDQAPLGIAIFRGASFITEMANENYLELVDRKKEAFIGKPLFDSLPEVKAVVEPLLLQVLQTGIPFNAQEFPVNLNRYGKKEELSFFNLTYHPLREENGSIDRVMVVATEVTSLVNAKELLVQSEKQFRNLVMQSPIAMTIFTGEDHVIDMANDVMVQKLWRKPREQVMGKKVLDVFPELKDQKYAELLHEVYHNGITHNETESVAYVLGDDGMKKFWLDYEYHPLTDAEGKTFALMVTVNDVTQKVEDRRRIEQNEERLRMAIQSTGLGTWEYYPQTSELNWSEECRKIYGLPENMKVDFDFFAAHIYPTDRQSTELEISRSMQPGSDGTYDISYRIKRFDDSSIRWIKAKGKVYFDNEQLPERFVGTVVDITGQKEFEQALEKSEQRTRLALEAAEMGSFDWDFVTNEFTSSQKLNEIFGFFQQQSISHKDLLNAFHPQDKPRRDKAVAEAAEKGSLSYEVRIIWQDHSIHWVKVYGKMMYDEQQRPQRMYGTAIDTTAERNTVLALEENTARLNIAIESAELGTWELNMKTLKLYYSRRYLEMIGFKNGQSPSHDSILKKIHPLDIDHRNAAVQKAVETGVLDLEMRVMPDENNLRWVKGKGKVFYDENNAPEKMLGTLMDITETKNTLNILQESEERFRNVANNAPVLIWMAGTDMGCTFFNTAWLSYTGRSFDQEKGKGWLNGVHPDDRQYCMETYENAFKKREAFYMEYRLKRHDGEYRYVSDKGVSRFTADKIFEGYIGACQEIHEEKISSEKIRKSELLFKTISNASPVGLWMTDDKGQCTFVNETWINWTGVPYSEQMGVGFLSKMVESDQEEIYSKFLEAIKTNSRFSGEFRITRADGSIQWCLDEGSPYYDLDGNFAGYAGSVTDITEKKLVEEELERKINERTAALEKSNSELEQFAYVASHDLQEPLRKIRFFTERLETMISNADDTAKEYFQKIQKSSDRMNTLIRDLLDFSRLGKSNEIFASVNLSEILTQVRHDLELLIQQKEAVLAADPLPIIDAIPLQMQQLFYNLLSNALKFCRPDEKPFIEIRCALLTDQDVKEQNLQEGRNYYEIKVKDNGIGFSQEYAEQIFVIFQRLNDLHSYGGTGIGLALCRKIVLNHNGKITATATENKGAEFMVILPASQRSFLKR